MRLLYEKGRLQDFKHRTGRKTEEIDDWESYGGKGKDHMEKLEELKPDIVTKINEKIREEKERLRLQKEKEVERENGRKKQIEEDGGEWIYNAEYDHYDWVGEGPPKVYNDDPEFVPFTAEELKNIKQQEEEWLLADMEERRKQAQERKRIKQNQIKEAMETPIAAFPVEEKCKQVRLTPESNSSSK